MKTRNIENILTPPAPHFVGDGFRVHNFIPYRGDMQRMSPFIMMDYGSKFYFPPTDKPRGVGVHPQPRQDDGGRQLPAVDGLDGRAPRCRRAARDAAGGGAGSAGGFATG